MTTHPLPSDHDDRLARARLALDGLSVGDALGETCFYFDNRELVLSARERTIPAPWRYTDDTEMALGIFEVLTRHGRIDQDDLAATFARRYALRPNRGYGSGAHRLLAMIGAGAAWREAAEVLFNGGSFGNGSAMRIAPVAGYFADDGFEAVAEQAALSAAVTHAHPEGIAGGIAAAVAGAYAYRNRERAADEAVRKGLFEAVIAHAPKGAVRKGLKRAAATPFDTSIDEAAGLLGDGCSITCQDTVPLCVWVAARHLGDYRESVVRVIEAGGDIDTNAAIVGGIAVLAAGPDGIPAAWLDDREPLQLRSR